MAEIQFNRGGGKAFRISNKFVLILHIFFSIFNTHGQAYDHIGKYFQNLHGKASKFFDFPQHSINYHLPVFKDRSTQNWDRSNIKEGSEENKQARTRKQPKDDQVYEKPLAPNF